MKFMTLVHETNRPTPEPPADLFAAIGGLQAQESAAGTLVEIGGLMPIKMSGAMVSIAGGSVTVTDGPFVEAKELVGGFAVYDLPDVETAIAKTEAFLKVHRDHWPGWEGWVEIRQLFEAPPA